MDDKAQKIKELLSQEALKDNPDFGTILSLSSELAKQDQENIRFSVDAGIINRLGKELVARQETAVSELVKNSYDADATDVKLVFYDAWEEGGRLTIDDNGLGMTRQQLIDGFMRLSSADKIHNPTSERYKRIRAGKKGIGRFATQRLGDKLTIITQTLSSPTALQVIIDWEDFATDKDLISVSNSITEIPKTKEEGTTLIIGTLREGWSDAMIKRVYRYTSELLQPFPLSETKIRERESKIDPGFKSSYFREIEGELIGIVDEQTAFYQHALAEITGYVLDDGQGCWSLKSEKLDFEEEVFLLGKDRDDPQSPFTHIKNIHFSTYYFIYESSLLPPQTLGFIRDVAHERGGIRIYRNGFRVLPYGEKGNDWLGLDESTAKRVILGSHRNINFFGFVEITDTSGVVFDETSSREGLLENDAFRELTDFVHRAIINAVIKIAEIRGRKATTSQQDWTRNEALTPTSEVDSAIEEISQLLGEGSEGQLFSSNNQGNGRLFQFAVTKLKENREQEKIHLAQERQRLIDEINMLRILAGLGLVIGEFVHEVKRFLPAFDADITHLQTFLAGNEEPLERANRLDFNLKSFTAYTAYFDKAISQNVLRELRSLDLIDVVNDFEEVISSDIKRTAIIFGKPIFHSFDLWTTPMHPSEWASILFNLYTNSKKAIKRRQTEGKILIECGEIDDKVYLEFSDNGDGIPKGKEEVIFDAFYTTSGVGANSGSEIENLTGTGLGLKIIKDIVESYGGEIFVDEPTQGYNTTFRIEIPKK